MGGYSCNQKDVFLFALCMYINDVSSSISLEKVALIENVIKGIGNLPSLVEELSKFNGDDFKKVFEDDGNDQEKYLNISELIVKYGYKVETHRVQTEDGYILTLYRIPGSGEPVMMVHGVLSSAVDWVTIGARSLPYLMADRGFDVWLPNLRGSVNESQSHTNWPTKLNPEQYWDFSFDESGRFDLPAVIDYILSTTSKSKVKYIGHSMGTTVFFVLCSVRPEYNEKISQMVALSPVAWMSHLVSPLPRIVSPLADLLHVGLNAVGLYKFDINRTVLKILKNFICGDLPAGDLLCDNITFLLFGFSYAQINLPKLRVYFTHAPAAASTRTIVHYGQLVNSGRFRQFDYGVALNLNKYGSLAPPDYPVEYISAPVALFYAEGDWFSAVEDVNILKSKLPNVIKAYKVPFKPFCHSDYLWAKDVKELVYDKILSLFKY